MSKLPYTREHIRELLGKVDGELLVEPRILMEPRKTWVYDDYDLLETVLRIANRSFAEGMRLGSCEDNDELRHFLIERGGKR